MTNKSRRRKAMPPPTTLCVSGRSGVWIADEEKPEIVALRSSTDVAEEKI
jgi:hypothetical protein